jgi:hypothetical protein
MVLFGMGLPKWACRLTVHDYKVFSRETRLGPCLYEWNVLQNMLLNDESTIILWTKNLVCWYILQLAYVHQESAEEVRDPEKLDGSRSCDYSHVLRHCADRNRILRWNGILEFYPPSYKIAQHMAAPLYIITC